MTRRIGAGLLATVMTASLGACDTPPTTTTAPSSAPSPSIAAAATPTAQAACEGVPLVPATDLPPWSDRVFYEIFVRSFADSDGDGIGDLAGATAKLDYLNDGDPATRGDLGVTGIWLMPVAESPSYHGYDVTDYDAVEPDYGDTAALKTFVAAAHDRGIYVIVDFVINHTSRDHPWFRDALEGGPHRDWYVWSDTNPGWPPIAGPSPWHRTAAGDYYYGAFWEGMPDLNLRNSDVTAELERIAKAWLDEMGVDGFRIDAAKHLIEVDGAHQANTPETLAWLEAFTTRVHATHPDALILGEVFDIARTSGSFVPESSDLTFDFGLSSGFISALQRGRAAPIQTALGETLRFWPPNGEASFLSNHDQNRVMSQLNGDLDAAKLAAGMLMTAPGVPFIYYGEEIGMTGTKPDERIRTPMQWSAEPGGGFTDATPWEAFADDWQTVNVAAQDPDLGSLLSTYRGAIVFRQSHPALLHGTTFAVDGGAESVSAWLRASGDDMILTVLNLGEATVTDYGLTLDAGPLCGVTAATWEGTIGDPQPLEAAVPAISLDGGFTDYRPFEALAPKSGYVVELVRR